MDGNTDIAGFTGSDLIGINGVAILLIAFLLNLVGWLKMDSKVYLLLNFIGAALACAAAVIINYLPFVVLEGVWSLVALVGLIRSLVKTKPAD